jgi:hypothetical protein
MPLKSERKRLSYRVRNTVWISPPGLSRALADRKCPGRPMATGAQTVAEHDAREAHSEGNHQFHGRFAPSAATLRRPKSPPIERTAVGGHLGDRVEADHLIRGGCGCRTGDWSRLAAISSMRGPTSTKSHHCLDVSELRGMDKRLPSGAGARYSKDAIVKSHATFSFPGDEMTMFPLG